MNVWEQASIVAVGGTGEYKFRSYVFGGICMKSITPSGSVHQVVVWKGWKEFYNRAECWDVKGSRLRRNEYTSR